MTLISLVALFTMYLIKHDVARQLHDILDNFQFLALLQLTHCTNVVARCNPGKPNTPRITAIAKFSVSISITRPAGAVTSKVIIYLTKYRKVGDTAWQSLAESSSTSVTISSLHSHTNYEITVAAKYKGGRFGPTSDPLKVKTKCGKCWFKVQFLNQYCHCTVEHNYGTSWLLLYCMAFKQIHKIDHILP